MIGAPKAPAGGFSITSLPRPTESAPTAPAPSQPAEQTRSGRSNNPVLRSLLTDSFEGLGAKGKGLGLGHLKRAARAEKPTESASPESLQKLVEDLKKVLEQLLAKLGQTPQPAPTPENTGIVPPGAVQGTPPSNTGIVPPGAVQG